MKRINGQSDDGTDDVDTSIDSIAGKSSSQSIYSYCLLSNFALTIGGRIFKKKTC